MCPSTIVPVVALGAPRGIYSGCIGYLSVNDTFDLNVVIRTVVLTKEELIIGCGGAIVVQSDPVDELEEMELKAKALLDTIAVWEASGQAADMTSLESTS